MPNAEGGNIPGPDSSKGEPKLPVDNVEKERLAKLKEKEEDQKKEGEGGGGVGGGEPTAQQAADYSRLMTQLISAQNQFNSTVLQELSKLGDGELVKVMSRLQNAVEAQIKIGIREDLRLSAAQLNMPTPEEGRSTADKNYQASVKNWMEEIVRELEMTNEPFERQSEIWVILKT